MKLAPTRRGWILMILATASFGFALFNPAMIPSVFASALVAFALVSVGAAMCSLWHVSVVREPCENGVMGRQIVLPISITNHTRRVRQVIIVEEHCPFLPGGELITAVPSLAAGETRYVNRRTYPTARGEYQLDRIVLRGGDPAGLFRREAIFSCPRHILIQPAYVPLVSLPLRIRERVMVSATGRPIGVSGVGQEFFGVREYRPTDGIRFIHWKASARKRRLMVREFEENSTNQVTILLDSTARFASRQQEPSNFEFQIKVAASLVEYLAGTYCNLLFIGGDDARMPFDEGAAQSVRERVLFTLATLTPGKRTVADRLGEALERILPNSILYCLALEESLNLSDLFDVLLAKGVDIRWIHAPAVLFRPVHPNVAIKMPESPAAAQLLRPVIVNPRVNIQKILSYG